ncbi:MAG: TPM domain-containing protein [Bacteroidia bacterium]|nr:TPM domain-containing protein [Bacteroidia bacterium]
MSPKEFLGKENEKLIVQAIESAEHATSGEIRVHIESKCKAEVLDRAAWLFKKLKMHETKDRNGVLIYLSVNDRKFAIIGDSGINKVVPEGFWNDIKEMMIGHFIKGEFASGLINGIEKAGEQLKKYFPWQTDDVNELPDEISYGK